MIYKDNFQILDLFNDILVEYVAVVSIFSYQLNKAIIEVSNIWNLVQFGIVNDLVTNIDSRKYILFYKKIKNVKYFTVVGVCRQIYKINILLYLYYIAFIPNH